MDITVKLLVLTVWCSVLFPKFTNSQGYYYKHKDVNQYEIRNGKYRLIPTTTRPPTLIETFFPWTGSAYNSVRTPEEDAAILSSLSDPVPVDTSTSTSENDGIMSWLSIPGFGASTGTIPTDQQSLPPLPPSYTGPMQNYNNIPMPMYGAASQNEAVVVPSPVQENHLGMYSASTQPFSLPMQSQVSPQSQYQASSPSQYQASPPSQYQASPQTYIPQEVRNNVNPTFQFHQQVKDSIPIPSPTLPTFNQGMFPYPYSPSGNLDFIKGTPEKSSSIMDMISNYFAFGKRSDLEDEGVISTEDVVQARSMTSDNEYETGGEDHVNLEEMELKEAPADDDFSVSSPTDGKAFPCPKSGIWRWNGEVCIAVGPVPVWACRPNDLIVSGKIAICRNKIYFSPKVINNIAVNE